MLDWLKFFPYCSRLDYSPEEIRGPYFPAPKKNKWILGDSFLRFEAPWSNPVFSLSHMGRVVNSKHPKNRDILKYRWDKTYPTPDSKVPVSEWNFHVFYSNTWYFVGPWFTGSQARLTAKGVLLTLDENNRFKEASFFHPRILENAVAYELNNSFGYKTSGSGRGPHFRGPLNWAVLPVSNSIQAVVCDVHCIGNSSKDNPTLRRNVYIPISHSKLILLVFDFGGTSVLEDELRAKPLFNLCNSIIHSLRLEVGDKTLAEWNKVKDTCPDMSITDTFGELKWPLKIEKSKKRKEVDVTPKQEWISG